MSDCIDGSGRPEDDGATKLSRRRPGRRQDVHPALIPLLRGAATLDIKDPAPFVEDAPASLQGVDADKDDLSPARGILLGVALSVPIWIVLIFGACHLLD
jgi:hypothetical protein